MKRLVFLAVALVACSKQPKEEAAPIPSSSAAVAAVASAAASALPHTTATATATAAGSQLDGVVCRVAGPTRANIHFRFETMKGTVLIDGGETRRILTKATPHGATYVLQFLSYETGDRKPAAEKLVPGQSIVARIVADGDHDNVYFDGDVRSAGLAGGEVYRCEK